MNQLEFGALPFFANPRQAWGCRAIISKGKFDIPIGRADYFREDYVNDEDKAELFDALQYHMDNIASFWINKRLDRFKTGTKQEFSAVSKSGKFKFYGYTIYNDYLYVGVWEEKRDGEE